MPLSAAETNRALLSFNFHLQSASLEWLLKRHTKYGDWRRERSGPCRKCLDGTPICKQPCKLHSGCVYVCVCSYTFYIQILTK